ncbi:FHA domain-containing protein [Saccharothrix sp. NPDC042600]|uniref:FHA domain-containing protein n=1 Tax=Saccharothrix TaxID=2071 RepID=UPI0033E9B73A|nr:hypothetical protein GCM10017745_53920 [Saccharothrix mutabilis subsp. capreolus]
MATCPSGHTSATDDYCDVCGTAIADPPPAPVTPPAPEPGDTCAACGAPRVGRFCEDCGHDSLTPPPTPPRPDPVRPASAQPEPAPAGSAERWHVTVEADRAYFDRVVEDGGPDATALDFPPFCPPRRFDLVGPQVTIGRRSRSRGIFPTVDLVGPPEDPGVSHSHALLVPTGDGWSVVDLGSTNGTTVNDEPNPLRPNTPRPLADGDRIHVGAWTTITLRRTP